MKSCTPCGVLLPALHACSLLTFNFVYRLLLLALVAILSQSLLTLVSRNLVSFFLLTVWHNCVILIVYNYFDIVHMHALSVRVGLGFTS